MTDDHSAPSVRVRKVTRSIGLLPAAWAPLEQLAKDNRCSIGNVVEMLLEKFWECRQTH